MKEIIAHVSFTIVKDEEKHNTTPLLVMKTLTSIRDLREGRCSSGFLYNSNACCTGVDRMLFSQVEVAVG